MIDNSFSQVKLKMLVNEEWVVKQQGNANPRNFIEKTFNNVMCTLYRAITIASEFQISKKHTNKSFAKSESATFS